MQPGLPFLITRHGAWFFRVWFRIRIFHSPAPHRHPATWAVHISWFSSIDIIHRSSIDIIRHSSIDIIGRVCRRSSFSVIVLRACRCSSFFCIIRRCFRTSFPKRFEPFFKFFRSVQMYVFPWGRRHLESTKEQPKASGDWTTDGELRRYQQIWWWAPSLREWKDV